MSLDDRRRSLPDDVHDGEDGDEREAPNADGISSQVRHSESVGVFDLCFGQLETNLLNLLDAESHSSGKRCKSREDEVGVDDLVGSGETDADASHQAFGLEPETEGSEDEGDPTGDLAGRESGGIVNGPNAGAEVASEECVRRERMKARSERRDDVNHEMDQHEDGADEQEGVERSRSLATWGEGEEVNQGGPDQTSCDTLSGGIVDVDSVPIVQSSPSDLVSDVGGVGRDGELGVVVVSSGSGGWEGGGSGESQPRHGASRHGDDGTD